MCLRLFSCVQTFFRFCLINLEDIFPKGSDINPSFIFSNNELTINEGSEIGRASDLNRGRALDQGWPSPVQKSYYPAAFRCILSPTHLNQMTEFPLWLLEEFWFPGCSWECSQKMSPLVDNAFHCG